MAENYPFGRTIESVTAQSAGEKPIFVLGVYPSAVHARWQPPDGNGIKAVAVANEPEPFWDGSNAEEHVSSIKISEELGILKPTPGLNGASGRALDELVLKPLQLSRSHVHIADIHNRYMANGDQQAAVERSYNRFVEQGLAPAVRWTLRHDITEVPSDRVPSLKGEMDEVASDWVITLGNEPLHSLSLAPLSAEDYGTPRTAKILGRVMQLLPLVHTRQAAKHGSHSAKWFDLHLTWLSEGAGLCAKAIRSNTF